MSSARAPGARAWARPATWEIQRGTLIRGIVIAGLLAFVLLGVPSLVGSRWLTVFTTVAIYSVVALGVGILYGRVGMVSLYQIALLGVGGWVALRLWYAFDMPFLVLLVLTGLITMVVGTVIGLPALRLSGLHLALITLMAAAAVAVALRASNFPTGGGGFFGIDRSVTARQQALARPDIAVSLPAYYRYAIIVCAIMFLLALWHVASKPGRAWAAIRQSEPAALAGGVNIVLYKLWGFALASFITGVAGCLLAATGGGLSAYQFQTEASIQLFAVSLMGGIYSLWGAVVAGFLMRVLPELLKDWGVTSALLFVLFGIGVIQVIWTAPRGLVEQFPKDMAKLGRLLFRVGRRVAGAREPGT